MKHLFTALAAALLLSACTEELDCIHCDCPNGRQDIDQCEDEMLGWDNSGVKEYYESTGCDCELLRRKKVRWYYQGHW